MTYWLMGWFGWTTISTQLTVALARNLFNGCNISLKGKRRSCRPNCFSFSRYVGVLFTWRTRDDLFTAARHVIHYVKRWLSYVSLSERIIHLVRCGSRILVIFITSLLMKYPRASLLSKRDTNCVVTIDFIRKCLANVYHYELGRLMFLRSLRRTFIPLRMIYGVR